MSSTRIIINQGVFFKKNNNNNNNNKNKTKIRKEEELENAGERSRNRKSILDAGICDVMGPAAL